MECTTCAGTGTGGEGRTAKPCVCRAHREAVDVLLRLLAMLGSCGLSAGAPPVLQLR
jgi:hypothetical protein